MLLRLKSILLLTFMGLQVVVFAQFQANNWNFGDSAAVSFNDDMLVYVNGSGMMSSEGCASISDECGNLLFYTNGEAIFDRAGNVMPNGVDGFSGHQSGTQSALIVPQPGSTNLYYVFTNDARERELLNGLCYSIVDMNLNGGMGDVVMPDKNVMLLQPSSEKLTAVRHSNGVDVWVVAHRYYSNLFYSWLVTAGGIQGPVLSTAGSVHEDQGAAFNANAVGQMKLSPDGTKLALTLFEEDKAELFDFDASTGEVSNAVSLPINMDKTFGVAWSGNSQMLYISSEYDIFQYDMTAADIPASKTNIYSNFDRVIRGMQIGPDGKIYISRLNSPALGAINSPNLKGVACNPQNPALFLGDDFARACLPNFIQSYFDQKSRPQVIINSHCTDSIIDFTLNTYDDVDSVKWNFGDPASGLNNNSNANQPQHVFQSPGDYFLTVRIYRFGCPQPLIVRTTIVIENVPVIELGNDTAICVGDSLTLGEIGNPDRFLWSTGDTTDAITVKDTGLYTVEVFNLCETIYDTIHIGSKDRPTVSVLGDDQLCVNATQTLQADHQFGVNFIWNGDPTKTDPFLQIDSGGTYRVDVSNDCGVASDSITVTPVNLPFVELPSDTIICTNFEVQLAAQTSGADYLWSTGETTQSITVTSGGVYRVDVSLCGVTVTDSVNIFHWETVQNFTPSAFSPNADFTNDSFGPVISFTMGDTNYRFVIFDRWGTKIVDTEDMSYKWDGYYQGKPAPQDMYMYILEFRSCTGKKRRVSGTFLLIR